MSSTYFSSLSGMLAASYGLQNTSNNVANMQTPGFKRSDVFYSSLGSGNGEEGLGSGVRASGKSINFSQGSYADTSKATDLAVVGQGFFVVKLQSGDYLYTRDGEFEFNKDGVLIDKHSNGQVQGYNSAGNLVPIYANGPKHTPGRASSQLFLMGKFLIHPKSDTQINEQTGSKRNKYQNVSFDVNEVYDANGKAHKITLEFQSRLVDYTDSSGTDTNLPTIPTPSDPTNPTKTTNPNDIKDDGKTWDLVRVTYDDEEITNFQDQQSLVFDFSNQLNPGASTIKLRLNQSQDISIEFGDFKEGIDNIVMLDNNSNTDNPNIKVRQNDGYSFGTQYDFSFDENGQIIYKYDNNQTITGIPIGLACFDDEQHHLQQTKDNLFKANSDARIHFGRPNHGRFGSIISNKLEKSNVDSTAEFANIVILQRMFQACSQIMDIDKQLLEDLEAKS